jgi:beta-lactamase regulating signal transducer with metallopeptidase domain
METSSHNLSIKFESSAPAASYATNGFVFTWGAMTFNQIMMLIGTVLAIATFAVNLYFQRRRERREQELHELRMQLPDRRE